MTRIRKNRNDAAEGIREFPHFPVAGATTQASHPSLNFNADLHRVFTVNFIYFVD